jgi:hypothetical protein
MCLFFILHRRSFGDIYFVCAKKNDAKNISLMKCILFFHIFTWAAVGQITLKRLENDKNETR